MPDVGAITFMSQIESPAIKGFDILAIVYHYNAISGIDSSTNGKEEKTNHTNSNDSYKKVYHIKSGGIYCGRESMTSCDFQISIAFDCYFSGFRISAFSTNPIAIVYSYSIFNTFSAKDIDGFPRGKINSDICVFEAFHKGQAIRVLEKVKQQLADISRRQPQPPFRHN